MRRLQGLVWTLALGCGGDVREGAPVLTGVTVRDSVGIAIVESHTPVFGAGRFWAMSLEPEIVLGERSAASDAVGGDEGEGAVWQVTGLARLVDGRIAVLSRGNKQLYLLDASGEITRTIGTEGRGPGEFTGPEHLQYRPPDTLVVWDQWMGPVAYFDTTGALLHQTPLDLGRIVEHVPGASADDSRTVPLADGSFVLGVEDRFSDHALPPEGTLVRHPPVEFFRVDMEDHSARSLGVWDGMERWVLSEGDRQASPFLARSELFFTDLMVTAHVASGGSPPRVYVSEASASEVVQFSAEGAPERVIRWTTEPLAVTDRADRARRDFFRRLPAPGGWSAVIDGWPRRDRHPPVGGLVVDHEGNLWVKEWSDSESGLPDQWSVFSSEGRWLGSLRGPPLHQQCMSWPQAVPCWIDSEWLLVVDVDELGVERIEGYRITRSAG